MRHTAWAAAAAVTLTASRFTLVAIIARRLSVATFGQYAYGQWLVDLAFLVCSLGVSAAVSRYLAEFRHDPEALAAIARRWLPYAVVLPLLAGVAVLLGVWFSDMALDPFALTMLALWAVTNGFWAMQTAALSGVQRFDLIFAANVLAGSVMVAGALLIPLGATGLGSVFGLMAVAASLATAIGTRHTLRLSRGSRRSVEDQRWRTMRRYAVNMWITSLLWSLVWSRGEMPIVRASLGDSGVAHYAAALTLFGGAIQGVMLAVSGVAPQLTRLWGEGSRAEAMLLARKLLDAQLLICGIAAVMLICFSPDLMRLAFGQDYRGQYNVLIILSLGLLAMAMSAQNHLLQIATDARFNRNSTLLGLAVLFGLGVWLIFDFGLVGAALARAVTMLIMAAVTVAVVLRFWGAAMFSWRNLSLASLVVGISAGIVLWHGDLSLILRGVLAGIAASFLAATIRDSNGNMQAVALLARAWPELFLRSPGMK